VEKFTSSLLRTTDMLIMGSKGKKGMTSRTKKTLTSYPHIVKVEGVCGGEAIIEDTRIAVWHVVGYYYKVGMAVEEILADWDYLTPAQVFSALAYYHDNKDEVDRARAKNSYEAWLEQRDRAAL
jgi:uncharacterized protein (DUF433 family)